MKPGYIAHQESKKNVKGHCLSSDTRTVRTSSVTQEEPEQPALGGNAEEWREASEPRLSHRPPALEKGASPSSCLVLKVRRDEQGGNGALSNTAMLP